MKKQRTELKGVPIKKGSQVEGEVVLTIPNYNDDRNNISDNSNSP